MAFVITCEQFKTTSAKNSKLWKDKIKQCDEIVQAEGIAEGAKKLFYSLAAHGHASTMIQSHAEEVLAALQKRYYEATIEATVTIISMGKSIWTVDSDALSNGKFSGKEIVSDITKEDVTNGTFKR